jgi:CRP/FNR family transcriptional regulator, cyclic AMP receptor protein
MPSFPGIAYVILTRFPWLEHSSASRRHSPGWVLENWRFGAKYLIVADQAAAYDEPSDLVLSGRVRLLEVDPGLGSRLEGAELTAARDYAVLPAIHLNEGSWDIEQLRNARGVRGDVYGFLLASGTVTIDATFASRRATRLIAAGELVLLDGWESDTLPVNWGWSVLAPTTIAVLDDRIEAIAHRWPSLMTAIAIRGADQTRRAQLHQAISQLPRVEDRLLALMWSLAESRGIVRKDGVHLPLTLTHEAIAQMIGARRPTVSLGLTALSEQGALSVEEDGWLLAPDSLGVFAGGDSDTG